ncbi:MAG TPA: hypothetical protein VFR81_18135 [Longimicrobium sp.]|nr:hypothetical protein [Longimicrobium sp.]
MPFTLPLPEPWRSRRWKVKIAEKERMEPPHVTIYHRSQRWRLALRGGEFLDPDPDPAEVPRDLVSVVREQFPILRVEWDQMYPHNPVSSKESVHE